jgi:hypothetical protein
MRQNSYTSNLQRLALVALLLGLTAPAMAQYGNGVIVEVPRVEEGVITLDGSADEAAWANAVEVDLTANWDGGFYDCNPATVPDISAFGQLLYTDNALYVSVVFEDYELYFENPFAGDQIWVGVDLTHAGDDQIDADFAGWPANAPDLGPVGYRIGEIGITTGYFEGMAVDSGWVAGEVFVDQTSQTWGVEMAILGDEIMAGTEVGFNIGGAAGIEACANEVEDAYGYFSWQVCEDAGPEGFCNLPGGTIVSDAGSFATLQMAGGLSNEDGASVSAFALASTFPNPFRASTTLEYTLQEAADVRLAVYDVLGREVAVLAEGLRPAGTEQVTWDAAALPTGLYVGQLRVNGTVVGTRKLQLVR